jgi:hypothetical protein
MSSIYVYGSIELLLFCDGSNSIPNNETKFFDLINAGK